MNHKIYLVKETPEGDLVEEKYQPKKYFIFTYNGDEGASVIYGENEGFTQEDKEVFKFALIEGVERFLSQEMEKEINLGVNELKKKQEKDI